jgi:hypothetical protein
VGLAGGKRRLGEKRCENCKKPVDPLIGTAIISVPQRPGLLKSSGSFTENIGANNGDLGCLVQLKLAMRHERPFDL